MAYKLSAKIMENIETQQEVTGADNVTSEVTNSPTVEIKGSKILEWGLYILGAICIIYALVLFCNDLELGYDGDIYKFKQKSYVGGDAYNFIISATRSTAVMVKSLIMAVMGCSAFIIGRLSALISIKKNESK